MRDIIIAIDGHSGCGKSTTSKLVAEHFNYKYLDSGAMYRAITLYLLRNKISYDNEDAISNNLSNIIITFKYVDGNQNTFLNNENVEKEIRGDKISNNVSKYSSISIIREHLVSIQKEMGKRKKIVIEGRDITTVVFPDAEIKIFMTADIEVRAKRRFEDMKNNNPEVTYSDVLENLSERDSKDSNRKDSPLRVADEAIVIDTSDLEINEQTHKIIDIIKNKF
ncbi:MAG: cytidylate kinase [Rhodothermaeota bacterium MED-G16]|nr:MAG: cytidylate kinase [Rhodothermaeota bacterium MED-G16]